ncbi:MAG: DUF4252 domain-containing protein [Flavobacteriaceae bacterium]|nr:DUF4252 domain-containing protein [Flavobacteriaceae bacterium]
MKKVIIYFGALLMLIVNIACSSEASLQKYYIDSQENKNFISLDVPASVLKLKDNVTPEEEEALASLKKFNILAFKKDNNNDAEYTLEKQKVKTILKNSKFKELMRIKDKGRNIVIKYEGSDDYMDEVIIYASDKEQGFALVRVLGDKMNPAKIMKLVNSIKDIDSDGFKQLEGLFKIR